MVTSLILDSNKKPDQICESYIIGKILAKLFPPSINYYYSPLALIHSDLHKLLLVTTYKGYKYWIIFINDAICF